MTSSRESSARVNSCVGHGGVGCYIVTTRGVAWRGVVWRGDWCGVAQMCIHAGVPDRQTDRQTTYYSPSELRTSFLLLNF